MIYNNNYTRASPNQLSFTSSLLSRWVSCFGPTALWFYIFCSSSHWCQCWTTNGSLKWNDTNSLIIQDMLQESCTLLLLAHLLFYVSFTLTGHQTQPGSIATTTNCTCSQSKSTWLASAPVSTFSICFSRFSCKLLFNFNSHFYSLLAANRKALLTWPAICWR